MTEFHDVHLEVGMGVFMGVFGFNPPPNESVPSYKGLKMDKNMPKINVKSLPPKSKAPEYFLATNLAVGEVKIMRDNGKMYAR